jgi:hypothetical protein
VGGSVSARRCAACAAGGLTRQLRPRCRYLQELSIKREFVWPHLDAQQRAAFLEFRPTRAAWLNRLLKLYLHAVALSYILAVSLILGRVAARHFARPPFHVLSEQCPISRPRAREGSSVWGGFCGAFMELDLNLLGVVVRGGGAWPALVYCG